MKKWCSRLAEVGENSVSTVDETCGAVSPSEMPASGSIWAAESHEGPEVFPFSQVIGSDRQSFVDVGKRCETPGLVAKALRLTQGKQCEHLLSAPISLAPTPWSAMQVDTHSIVSSLSEKSAKAEKTGLWGNWGMFLKKIKRHPLLAFQNMAFQISHKGAHLLCNSVCCLWHWIFFFNDIDKTCIDAL